MELSFKEYLNTGVSILLLSETKDDLYTIYPRNHGEGGYVAGSGQRWQNVHDLPTVKPRKVGPRNEKRINNYTNSSEDINKALYHAADGHLNNPITARMKSTANGMSAAFTKDTTNQTPLTTYSGVSAHLGTKLVGAKNGSFHHLAAFTSTTTDKRTAHGYAQRKHAATHPDENVNIPHVIKFHLKPGTGMSGVHHSNYNENEVIVDKGTKIEKVKSELKPTNHGGKVWVHHVVAHPEKLGIDQYRTDPNEHHNNGLIPAK